MSEEPGSSRRNLHRRKKEAREHGDIPTSSSSSSDDEGPCRRRQKIGGGDGDGNLHSESDEEENRSDDGIRSGEENNPEAEEGDDEDDESEQEQDNSESPGEGEAEEEQNNIEELPEEGEADEERNNIEELPEEGEADEEQNDSDELPEEENMSHSSSSSSSEYSSDENEEEDDEEGLSEDDDEDQGAEEAGNADVPLYPNARITLMESLIMLLTLALRFSLSGECLAHILELIEMHCPAGNMCKSSLYKFKNYFVEIGRKALVLHYYCEHCMSELAGKEALCRRCGANTTVAFFIEIPLLAQLQRLFLRDGFIENLRYRFNRVKKHANNYEDLYDGALYKEQMENGFLSFMNNISFTWYSDGIQIFKSSKYSVWPLFFCINELRYKLRTQKENILLCGLWFGKCKPKPNLFLKPFRETFETFKNEGYRFNVPNGESIVVRALLLYGTCDLPAKSLFLRTKLYNAYYGCGKCYSRGARAPAGRTSVHVHPYTAPRNIRKRKHAHVMTCARIANRERKKHHLGIKGIPLLYFMMPDVIRGVGIDIMHQVFLGLCKMLTKFWFDPKFSDEVYSCSAMLDVINARLASISPPSFIQRMTRTLKDLKLWKAKEYKLFFFYYSVPILSDILPREYLIHHLKLISALSLLCQDSIFPEQVDRAGDLLEEYVREFQQLYTVRFLGMNVHLLLHLKSIVKDLGPLWVLSCFFFEDLNGQLVKLIHSPYQPGIQVCSAASLFMSLRLQIEKLHPNSQAKQFCLKLSGISAKYTLAERINDKTCVVGKKAFKTNVPLDIVNIVRHQLGIVAGRFMSFSTLRKSGVFFNSLDRTLAKRCSQYICFNYNGAPHLGRIRKFVRWSNCNCINVCACLPARFMCVVNVYERLIWLPHEVQNVSIFHLFKIAPTDEVLVIDYDAIKCVCFYLNANGMEYIAMPVNSLEYE